MLVLTCKLYTRADFSSICFCDPVFSQIKEIFLKFTQSTITICSCLHLASRNSRQVSSSDICSSVFRFVSCQGFSFITRSTIFRFLLHLVTMLCNMFFAFLNGGLMLDDLDAKVYFSRVLQTGCSSSPLWRTTS